MAFDNTAYMNNLATNAQNIGATPYTGFGQSTQVDANPWQQQAWQNTFNRGVQGAAEVSNGRNQLNNTINGQNFQSAAQGPVAQGNMFANNYNTAANGQNAFMGMNNPYLNQSIDSAMGDISRNYSLNAKPQMESSMIRSGSFGNSGLQQLQGEQQRQLAETMGRTANDMRMNAYSQSAGLNESMLGRQFEAGSQQLTNQVNAEQARINNNFSSGMNQAQRNDAMTNFNVSNQLDATKYAPQYAQSDYIDLQAMQQAGNSLQGQQQSERTAGYNQYLDAREWPFKTLGAQAGAMGSGSVGSSTYQQQQPNQTANTLGLLGAGLSLYKAFGG